MSDKFVFWRIVFDVVDSNIRLQQEITCWELVEADTHYWRRNERLIVDLQPQIVGYVNLTHDHAEFRGGYIECDTHDIREFQINCLGTPGSGTSIPFDGENISIRADVRLPESVDMPEYPFFYLEQKPFVDENGDPIEQPIVQPVMLTEQRVHIPDQHLAYQVKWEIDGRPYLARYPFGLNPFEDWHRLRVHQDDGPDPDTSVFKFRVDAVPLQPRNLEVGPNNYQFDSVPQRLIIGGKPDLDGNIIGLHGDIAYLEFDPNDSCRKCLLMD
jgi:hypothetical protein